MPFLRRRRVSQSLDKLPHRLALSRVHHRLMLRLLRLMNNELADNIRFTMFDFRMGREREGWWWP